MSNQRVPGNTNLTRFSDSHYRGLPVVQGNFPLIEDYLESIYQAIEGALQRHGRLFAVRVDLRFPTSYWPLEGQMLGNDYYQRFTRKLRNSLSARDELRRQHGKRVHSYGLELLAAREFSVGEEKPHYHVLILLNGHAYKSLGDLSRCSDGLYTLIHEAWAYALRRDSIDCGGLAYIPEFAQYRINSTDDRSGRGALFQRASYLAKERTKQFDDGFHSFLRSRSNSGV